MSGLFVVHSAAHRVEAMVRQVGSTRGAVTLFPVGHRVHLVDGDRFGDARDEAVEKGERHSRQASPSRRTWSSYRTSKWTLQGTVSACDVEHVVENGGVRAQQKNARTYLLRDSYVAKRSAASRERFAIFTWAGADLNGQLRRDLLTA